MTNEPADTFGRDLADTFVNPAPAPAPAAAPEPEEPAPEPLRIKVPDAASAAAADMPAETDALGWKIAKVHLRFPIQMGEGQPALTAIVMREPDAGVLEQFEDLGMEDGVAPSIKQLNGMFAALSGQPIEVIRKLHKRDFEAVVEASAPLLEG